MVQRSEQSTDDLFLFALSDDFGSDDAYDVELHLLTASLADLANVET